MRYLMVAKSSLFVHPLRPLPSAVATFPLHHGRERTQALRLLKGKRVELNWKEKKFLSILARLFREGELELEPESSENWGSFRAWLLSTSSLLVSLSFSGSLLHVFLSSNQTSLLPRSSWSSSLQRTQLHHSLSSSSQYCDLSVQVPSLPVVVSCCVLVLVPERGNLMESVCLFATGHIVGCWTAYLMAALGSCAYPCSSQLRLGHMVKNRVHSPLERDVIGRHLDWYLKFTAQHLLSVDLCQAPC